MTEDLNNAYLVLTGQELKHVSNIINELIRNFPNIHIILDVQEGDGLVKNASLELDRPLTQQITRLTIINIAQDVKKIGSAFLCFCNNLIYLDLSSLCQVTEIGARFLKSCKGLMTLDQINLPEYNEHLRNSLLKMFSENTEIGRMIRQIYLPGYVPAPRKMKSARK